MQLRRAMFLTILSAFIVETPAHAATLPAGFSEVAITGANTISAGTTIAFSPNGHLFVLEQGGTIEVYEGSGASAWTRRRSNFFANAPLVVDSSNERGLLGIAFDPNFASNRFVYVYYTSPSPVVRNRIVRYKTNLAGDLALPASARVIMNLEPLVAGNHNGGALHFGPDGKLYVAVGDNAAPANAQSRDNRLGKILRLNPNPNKPIPNDNPASIDGIAGPLTGPARAIWCAGLRNPYTFAFKPGENIMFINDVGQSAFEEINLGAPGANFGWGNTEGPFNPGVFPDYTLPIAHYHHDDGDLSSPANGPGFIGRAITGGAFYVTDNPIFPPGWTGDYFFADFINGWIRRFDPDAQTVRRFATNINGPVSLCVGPDGALYYLARNAAGGNAGRVYRVQRD